jgi:hypothetical protein
MLISPLFSANKSETPAVLSRRRLAFQGKASRVILPVRARVRSGGCVRWENADRD